MQEVIKKLKEYNVQIDLRQRFISEFNANNQIFTSREKNMINDYNNHFEQNIALKWILSEKYKKTLEHNTIDFWIINIWGGIRGFKPNSKNIEKLSRFKKQLVKGILSLDCFETISSLSKVASFLEPEKFVIYDSRVVYTLNWLILTCENTNGLRHKYFPMPSGRNKIITDFDMNTIINISHLDKYMNNTELYISKQSAYFDFCQFIKSNTIEIMGKNSKPYELEMLLFTLANQEIFQDLKSSLRLKV